MISASPTEFIEIDPGFIDAAETELAERSLYEYTKQAWPFIEPNPFVDNWHIGLICEHLQAVSEGQIENLLINIPPGCSKSLMCCVFWQTWEWTRKPWMRWFFASYDQSLSTRDSVRCKALIQSRWYQDRWGYRFQFSETQNQKTYYETDKGGYRLATSVGGHGTGEHPHRIVIDDPHKVKEAESELERQSVKDWWTLTMSLRGVALKVRRVVIMQRLHELDLAGCILEQGGYEHICLPMRYEVPSRNDKGLVVPRMLPTKIGGCDPRTSEGELLTPQQFGEQAVTSAEQSLGPYGIAGQLQQRPAPREGGMFKAAWFEPIDVAPPCETYIRGWDMAGTEGDGDFSAGCLIGRLDGVYYILDAVRGQWSSGMRNDRIVTLASEDAARGFDVKVWFERQPGADGEFVANQLKVRLIKEGYRADWYLPSVSKEDRADGLAAAAWAGKVRMVRGSWNRKFLDELMSFPNAAHDDQVDAASTAYNKLAMRRGVLVA